MIGNPMRRALDGGLGVPLMQMLYRQLTFLDDRIAST